MFKHATVSAWQRDGHEGTYSATIDGWTLQVTWHPEPARGAPGKRRGFSWTAEDASGKRLSGGQDEPIEEIENAMVAAEEAAKHAARVGTPVAPEGSGDAVHASKAQVREANRTNEGP